jgi:hypothetical protein
MKRLHATALAAALAAAVPAWGDPPPKPAGGDQVMTLTKDGKPHQYKVLKTYKHPSGGTAYDVKDEATGEVMTVVENATVEQVTATFKPGVTEVKTRVAGQADPTLQPKAYNGDQRPQKTLGPDPAPPAAPASQYTRPPVPAPKRWLGWLQRDAKPEARPAATPPKGQPPAPPVQPTVIEAAYHPDRVIRLIGCLRDDVLPSMREVAAIELAGGAGRGRPEVIEALMYSARHDPAATVRACCARCLGEMHVQTPACLDALRSLQHDKDASVRMEAGAALANLQQP